MGIVLGLVFSAGVFLIASGPRLATQKVRKPLLQLGESSAIDDSAWPEVVDDIASAVRAGMSLQQAVFHVAQHGSKEVREVFDLAHQSYLGSGDFALSLRVIASSCSSVAADKFCASLLIAHEVGGTELGLLLRTAAEVLRADQAMRGEIRARQSWTVNGARLAVGAPWVTVLLLSTRTDALEAYQSAGGVRLLIVCAAVSFIAYSVMVRIGRLPASQRILA